jgi:uncharacterized protein (TIRG00374 family)
MTTAVIIIAIRAWRWNVILAGLGGRLSVPDLTVVYGSAFFLGLVSPGRIGEAMRVWLVRHRLAGLSSAAFSVIFDRICDAAPTGLIAVCFIPFLAASRSGSLTIVVSLIVITVSVALILVLLYPGRLQAGVNWVMVRLLARWQKEQNRDQNSRTLGSSDVLQVILWSVVSQLCLVLQTYLLARAVGMQVNPLVTYAVVNTATIMACLPVTIGGIGTREVTVVWALTTLGFSTQQAVCYSFICLVNFLVALALSLVTFLIKPSGICEDMAAFRHPVRPVGTKRQISESIGHQISSDQTRLPGKRTVEKGVGVLASAQPPATTPDV